MARGFIIPHPTTEEIDVSYVDTPADDEFESEPVEETTSNRGRRAFVLTKAAQRFERAKRAHKKAATLEARFKKAWAQAEKLKAELAESDFESTQAELDAAKAELEKLTASL